MNIGKIPPVSDGPRPFWSVIVTAYNRTEYIWQALKSVVKQWTPDMEVLIQDDTESPKLADYLKKTSLDEKDERPFDDAYAHNPTRFGLYGSVNAAIRRARGQWIHVLHDDDYVLPGFYSRMRQAIEASPDNPGVAASHFQNLHEPEGWFWIPKTFRPDTGLLANWWEVLSGGNPIQCPAVAVKRSVYEHIGGFDEDNHFAADWEFWLRTTQQYSWLYVPEVLATFRVHPGGETRSAWKNGSAAKDLRSVVESAAWYLPPAISTQTIPQLQKAKAKEILEHVNSAADTNVVWEMCNEALQLCTDKEIVTSVFGVLCADQMAEYRGFLADFLVEAYREKIS